MRKIVLLFLILSGLLFATPAVSQNEALDFSIREVFVQCNANRWRGTKEASIWATDEKVQLKCGEFWKALYDNKQPSPFSFVAPGQNPEEIPYTFWRPAIEDALQITPEPK